MPPQDLPQFEDRELVEHYRDGSLGRLLSRHEHSSDSNSNSLLQHCLDLHNKAKIDLLELVERGSLTQLPSASYFDAIGAYCWIIPKLKTEWGRLLRIVKILVDGGGQDLAANQPNSALREWCAVNPDGAEKIVVAAEDGDSLAQEKLTFALEALGDLRLINRLVESRSTECRLGGLTALSRTRHSTREDALRSLKLLKNRAVKEECDRLRASLFVAALAVGFSCDGADLDSHRLAEEIAVDLLNEAGEVTLYQVARGLWEYHGQLSRSTVSAMLAALVSVSSEARGTLDEVDLALSALLRSDNEDLALEFVTKLLSVEGTSISLEVFDSFGHELLSGKPERLGQVVVRWLLSGVRPLCHGLEELVSKVDSMTGLELRIDSSDIAVLTGFEQIFVCRKAVGWFFGKPLTALSVLLAAISAGDEDVRTEASSLIFDYLLLNYHSVYEFLSNLDRKGELGPVVCDLLDRYDNYVKGLQAVPKVSELAPSETRIQAQQAIMSEEMRAVSKEAERKSFFASLFRKSVLLYGRGSISIHSYGSNKLSSTRIDLQSHEFSLEMPRMEIIDPLGLEYALKVFRVEQFTK